MSEGLILASQLGRVGQTSLRECLVADVEYILLWLNDSDSSGLSNHDRSQIAISIEGVKGGGGSLTS